MDFREFTTLKLGDKVQRKCKNPYAHTVTEIIDESNGGYRFVALGGRNCISNMLVPQDRGHYSNFVKVTQNNA